MNILVLNQVFSDMVYTTYNGIKDKDKYTMIDKLIMRLNKYYNKRKMTVIEDKSLLSRLETQYVNKVEEITEYSKGKEYSMSILCVAVLDYLINILQDKEMRMEFGSISTEKILFECEKHHRESTFNCYKLVMNVLNKDK